MKAKKRKIDPLKALARNGKIRLLMAYLTGFFGNSKKVNLWLSCPNPLLGGMSPETMIEVGRIDKLIKFVETQLNENS